MGKINPDLEYWLELFVKGHTFVKADQIADVLACWSKDESRPEKEREKLAEMARELFTHWALSLVQNDTPVGKEREAVQIAMEIAENKYINANGDRAQEFKDRQKLLGASTKKKQ